MNTMTPTPTLRLRPIAECISIINRAKDMELNFYSFQKFRPHHPALAPRREGRAPR